MVAPGSAGSIVLAGALAQRPGYGGHTWVFLQYLLGFRRLGFDVLLLDRLEPEMCVDRHGRACDLDRSENLRYLTRVVHAFGLRDDFAVLYDGGKRVIGTSRDRVVRRLRDADFLLNVMGYLDDDELLGAARRRVFLDIDPGFGQIWRQLGLADPFAGHDAFVTVGENLGRDECAIPTCGLEWITTPQPLVLDEWPPSAAAGDAFTSVGSWRGPYGPIEYEGRTYGLRVHEFRRLIELPRLTSAASFELALDIDPADRADLELLEANGWHLVEPRSVAGDPWAYRDFVRRSKAELMVAKNIYVDTNSGWFSDRSICYLASGRPVLAQETGFTRRYPTGTGLLAFSTAAEAAAGVESIVGDYATHSRAAREIAEAHFGSDRVLPLLLDRLG